MNKFLKLLAVCIACMIPGYFLITYVGFNGLTCLPLFWGGMLYMRYLDSE